MDKTKGAPLRQPPFTIATPLEDVCDLDAELTCRLERGRRIVGAGQDVPSVIHDAVVVKIGSQGQEVEACWVGGNGWRCRRSCDWHWINACYSVLIEQVVEVDLGADLTVFVFLAHMNVVGNVRICLQVGFRAAISLDRPCNEVSYAIQGVGDKATLTLHKLDG